MIASLTENEVKFFSEKISKIVRKQVEKDCALSGDLVTRYRIGISATPESYFEGMPLWKLIEIERKISKESTHNRKLIYVSNIKVFKDCIIVAIWKEEKQWKECKTCGSPITDKTTVERHGYCSVNCAKIGDQEAEERQEMENGYNHSRGL